MNYLDIIFIIFIIIESANVLALYFAPGSKMFNAVGIFKAWEHSKEQPDVHDFAKYLVYWVAGSKLIFICLLVVILFFGNDLTKLISILAMVISIASFYWKLFPLIRKMDKADQIDPKNYSKVLGVMITVFILVFLAAFVISASAWI